VLPVGDVRTGSPSFGQHLAVEPSEDRWRARARSISGPNSCAAASGGTIGRPVMADTKSSKAPCKHREDRRGTEGRINQCWHLATSSEQAASNVHKYGHGRAASAQASEQPRHDGPSSHKIWARAKQFCF